MCSGGRLLADFNAGLDERPDVPDAVESCLTWTADGAWIVWAHKVARAATRDRFVPLTGGEPYPADAVARCRFGLGHHAPHPDCSCGFHALSAAAVPPIGVVHLDVALSGRILAFEWDGNGVLFRASRQTVVRVNTKQRDGEPARWVPPDDPDGLFASRYEGQPRGAGPIHLRLPVSTPAKVEIVDDAGYCVLAGRLGPRRSGSLLAPV
jgi:hypothetical protein